MYLRNVWFCPSCTTLRATRESLTLSDYWSTRGVRLLHEYERFVQKVAEITRDQRLQSAGMIHRERGRAQPQSKQSWGRLSFIPPIYEPCLLELTSLVLITRLADPGMRQYHITFLLILACGMPAQWLVTTSHNFSSVFVARPCTERCKSSAACRSCDDQFTS
jgi:hypothetical protein